ncbi:MAG: glycosyltransferase, partial [Proteobacteria bacterium]
HTFGFFEFPDYAIEAYFSLKMRRAGLVRIDTVAVRLHSPELMLFRDNLLPARSYDGERLTRMSRELFSYQYCDKVLFGAPAMLERVALECKRFGIGIEDKAVSVEHPYPVHDIRASPKPRTRQARIHLGYVGRLEVRKGILRFLLAIAESEALRTLVDNLDIVFELFGADCTDQDNNSVKAQILALHAVPELRGRIVAHGYMAQADLKERTSGLDGFFFPSLFENYPNALLEVLHTDAPILVSEAGGMPYISRGLPGIYRFSYGATFDRSVEEFFCSIRPVPHRRDMYFEMAKGVNVSIATNYDNLSATLSAAPESASPPDREEIKPGIDFVIPYYNDSKDVAQSLKSIKAVMCPQDTLRVIDDASSAQEAHALNEIIARVFGEDERISVHRLAVNSGPSIVRNTGVSLGRNPLVQFLDADDHMDLAGFEISKRYILSNLDVDFVYGIQDNFGGKNHVWIPRDSSAMTCLDENYTHSAILIRRHAFEASGGFDAEMRLHFEDWQFNCKLALSGYRGEVVPFVTQHYRVREGSRTFQNLRREEFSRAQVIDRTGINRAPQPSLLQGELLELVGKYSNMVNSRLGGEWTREGRDEHALSEVMSLKDLCRLRGEQFVRTAYAVVLGRRADDAGLRSYLDKLERGVGPRSIIADMMSSAEMRSKRRVLPKEYYKALRLERIVRHPVLKAYK